MKKSIIIIIAAAILAVGFYGVRYVQTPVDVMTAKAANIEHKISAAGTIVYNESVYNAGTNGTFYSYAGEGERVGKDRLLATIYNGVVDKEVLQALNNIDKKLAELEENRSESTIYISDESSEQAILEGVKDKIIDAVLEGDISQIQGYKSRLENTTGLVSGGDVEAELEKLKNEKKRIEASIGQSRKDIYSSNSGIYATMLDGLEGIITPEQLAWYMVADYKSLAEPEESIMGSRTVQMGEKVCKVVDNHTWYAVTVLPKEQMADIEVGQNVELRVKELPGEVVSARIDYISPEPEGSAEYLIVIKCERYLEGVFNIRKSDIEIILDSFYGFEIPLHALRVQDGKNGVMVRKGSDEAFRECTILSRDDETGTVIIEPVDSNNALQAGDLIVLGEK